VGDKREAIVTGAVRVYVLTRPMSDAKSSRLVKRIAEMKNRFVIRLFLGLASLALLPGVVLAQFNGHNLRGDYGLQSGSQPAPGWYGTLLYIDYNIDTLRDRNGDALPSAGGDITVEGISPILWWVSDWQLWGGNYSILLAPSWVNNSLEAPALGIDDSTDTSFGDLYVQPINLGWHREQVDYMAGLGVFMPTGRYEAGADDNLGLGMWSLEIFGGATYFFDQARSWNASALAFYETHTEKEDSDAKVGDLLTIEGGVGKSFMDGAINVGAAYFAQWKVTDDDFGGVIPTGSVDKHQIFAVGPELSVPVFATEKVAGLLGARYLLDFGSESTTEGETFMVTFTLASL
jgi:hypothetical protein